MTKADHRRSARPSRRELLRTAALAAPLATGAGTLLSACAMPARRMTVTDVLELSARAVVEHIRNGDLKAEDYAAQLLRHSNAHMTLNAIITMNEQRVLERARAVDAARARGDTLGAAAGLPFGVKDQIDAAGYVTTGGNGNFKNNLRQESAPVVAAVERAGGIVFAKTNMPDMVAGYTPAVAEASANPYFGTPRNAYSPGHLVGGTSGGNGVAIAARMMPAAIGEDTTGSIRFPAACCGVAGLRPSTYTIENTLNGTWRKRYSDAGIVVPPANLQDTFGPMARTAADCAFLDTIITGEPVPKVNLREVRIAIPRPDYWDKEFVDPVLAQVCLDSFARLREAGAQLVEIDFDTVRGACDTPEFIDALKTPRTRDLAKWLAANLPDVKLEDIYLLREDQRTPPPPPPMPDMTAHEKVRIIKEADSMYHAVFREHGILAIAFPPITFPAPPLQTGGETMDRRIMIRGKPIDQVQILMRNIFWGPRMGGPGLNIAIGLASGLPVGLELTGLPGADSRILGLGIAVENVLDPMPPPPLMAHAA